MKKFAILGSILAVEFVLIYCLRAYVNRIEEDDLYMRRQINQNLLFFDVLYKDSGGLDKEIFDCYDPCYYVWTKD